MSPIRQIEENRPGAAASAQSTTDSEIHHQEKTPHQKRSHNSEESSPSDILPLGKTLDEEQSTGKSHSRHRPLWRKQLVDIERGFTLGLRSDSFLFVHFFIWTILIVAGLVLQLPLMSWAIVVLSCTLIVSAEFFRQVLKVIWKNVGHHLKETEMQTLRIATAAVFSVTVGALGAIGLVFLQQIMEMY